MGDPPEIWIAPFAQPGAARSLLGGSAGDARSGTISPDGRWIAYVSRASAGPVVFVRPFPDVDRAQWRISIAGEAEPAKSRSGDELFYRTPGRPGRLMSVPVGAGRDFQAGAPVPMFLADGQPGFGFPLYDVDVDGRRFLLVGADTRPNDARLVRIANVFVQAQRVP